MHGGTTDRASVVNRQEPTGGNNESKIYANKYKQIICQGNRLALGFLCNRSNGVFCGAASFWTNIDPEWNVWQIASKGSGYYEIVNENSGQALDVTNNDTTPGTDLDQYTVAGNSNQLWAFNLKTGGTSGGGSTSCGSRFLPVMGSCGYIKGANLAWLDGHYSYYLGVEPHNAGYGVAYSGMPGPFCTS